MSVGRPIVPIDGPDGPGSPGSPSGGGTSGGSPATSTSLNGTCSFFGWAGTTTSVKTLSLTAAASVGGSGIVTNTLSYTFDGVTFTNFFSSSAAIASAEYSVSVPSGTNLANVQVRATSVSFVAAVGTSTLTASGGITLSSLQIA